MFSGIRRRWRDTIYGFSNFIRWFPIIWNDRDWDWNYLAQIMEFKFGKMAISIGDNGRHIGCEKTGRQLRICQTLLGRLREDNYWDQAKKVHPFNFRNQSKLAQYQAEQDKKYLALLISKYFDHWWD